MSRILGSLARLWQRGKPLPAEVAPWTEEDAFMEAIRAAPDDDTPRLIYADWLEERGNPRAEFIRVQCELYRCPSRRRCKELSVREGQLLKAHYVHWVAPFRQLLGFLGARQIWFCRGFVEELALSAATFVQHASELLRLAPLRQLTIKNAHGRMEEVATCSHLAGLDTLHFRGTLEREDLIALARCPFLSCLWKLSLFCRGVAATEAQVLVAAPHRAKETEVRGMMGERVLIFGPALPYTEAPTGPVRTTLFGEPTLIFGPAASPDTD